MTHLVDANVLSETTRPQPDGRVVEWLSRHQAGLVVDPIVLGELRYGILRMAGGRRRARLERWFEGVVGKVACVPWDAECGVRWAELLADLRRSGNRMPVKDSMIAASALRYGLTLATRNTADFRNAGVVVIDPFA